jgi:DNA-binding transcriptional ArsR family regulator
MTSSRTRPGGEALTNIAGMPSRPRIEPSTAFELVLSSLHVADATAASRWAEAGPWAEHRRAIGLRRMAVLERLGGHPIFNLTGLAWDVERPRTADALMAHLRSLPPAELILAALGVHRRVYRRLTPPEVTRAAVAGDRAARREFLRTSWPDIPEWHRSARFLLSRPADALGADLLADLDAWHAGAFAAEEERVAKAQVSAASAVEAERPTWSVDSLWARLLPGLDYVPPAGIGEVVFVPDTVIRPSMVLVDHRSDFIATFPTVLVEGAGQTPPEQLVRLGRALGDDTRLKALRILARGPTTIVEIATELGVPRTTLSHHLGVLRGAGLVTMVVEDGRWGRLRLRVDGIDDAPRLLRSYLGQDGS